MEYIQISRRTDEQTLPRAVGFCSLAKQARKLQARD
jgi:hypothetical protein